MTTPSNFRGTRQSDSTEFESCSELDGLEEFLFERRSIFERRKLEKVHAGARGGKSIRLRTCQVDAEGRSQLLEVERLHEAIYKHARNQTFARSPVPSFVHSIVR